MYVDLTAHSNPQRVQVKYSNVIVTSVTLGGPVAEHLGHVPKGASCGGVGVLGVDIKLTPEPKRSAQCWGADELSSHAVEVVVRGGL